MANPIREKGLLADKNSKPMISTQQTLVADMATTGSTTSTPYGFTTAAQADSIATKINAILDILEEHGLMSAS